MSKLNCCIGSLAFIVSTIAIFYIGYVKSYLDDEVQVTFFIKSEPIFKMRFYDPFATEADEPAIDTLHPIDRKEFADYCRYRFGIVDDDVKSLEQCKGVIPNYLEHRITTGAGRVP